MLDDGASTSITNDSKDFIEPQPESATGSWCQEICYITHMVVVKWQLDDNQGRSHAFSKTGKFVFDVFLGSVAVEEW